MKPLKLNNIDYNYLEDQAKQTFPWFGYVYQKYLNDITGLNFFCWFYV